MKRASVISFLVASTAAHAAPVSIINPGAEINNGLSGMLVSDPSVLGWDGFGGHVAKGGTDYGNGGWRISVEDAEQVFQMTGHAIAGGEAFSLRFDAAPSDGSAGVGGMFTRDLALVESALRNGDFNEDTDPADSRTFAQTPWWENLGTAGDGSQATRTTLSVDGTRNAVLNRNGSRIYAVDTGHTLVEDERFRVSYQWRDASNWTDSNDRVRATLFTTDNNAVNGARTVLQSLDSDLSTTNSTYETQVSLFAPIPAAAAGKRLFLAIESNVGSGAGGFARVDNVVLERGTVSGGDTPGTVVAGLYVDDDGAREVIASNSFSFAEQAIGDWRHYHVIAPAGSLDAHVGKTIGVQFSGIESPVIRFYSIDNVQLDAYPTAAAHGFSIDWDATPDQVWPGSGFWGNRLHDWRVSAGRIECILGNRDRRTLHRTGTAVIGNGGPFSLSVRTGLRTGNNTASSRSGFLVGSGPALDWRAAMLVHDGLGRDFGLFCGLTGNGAAVIEDYSTGSVSALATGMAPPGGLPADSLIEFSAVPDGQNYVLTVSAYEGAAELPFSTASATLSSDRVLGSFGLLSHRGTGSTTYWFDDFAGSGEALQDRPEGSLAIVGAMHTISHGDLTLCAQLMPLDRGATPGVFLETFDGVAWNQVASAPVDPEEPSAFTAVFRIDDWPTERDVDYRLRVPIGGVDHFHTGTVRREPVDKETLTVASITCQRIVDGSVQNDGFDWSPTRVWHPHSQPILHIAKHAPDLIACTGDQIYNGQPTPEDSAVDFNRQHDYLYKWYLFALQFRELARDIPMFCMPDDHDVFQGNLWGEGGISAPNQEEGGYVEPAPWVRMVERTQYSSLPPADPYNPIQPAPRIATANNGGLEVYFTGIAYAGLGIAVIEDRKFKTGRNNPPPTDQLELLGDRQHAFLEAWARDWSGDQKVKFVISQSPFGNLHTHANTGYNYGLNDMDSHGWPPESRKDAWRLLRKSFMFQLAGDQHVSTLARHGIDAPRDAGYSFTSPAIANFFPRCWDPDHTTGGRTGTVLPYTGDFFFDGSDGRPASNFPHHVQMIGVANPREYYNQTNGIDPPTLEDRGAGYGLAKIDKATRAITFESWPRYPDPEFPQTGGQYPDWPVTIQQTDNEGREPAGFLPLVTSPTDDPVVWVIDEGDDELVYALRIRGRSFKPPVFDLAASYRVELREGDHSAADQVFTDQTATAPAHGIEFFRASARQIVAGTSVRLSWQTCASEGLTLDPGGIDLLPLSAFGAGFIELAPTVDTTYNLTSDDGAGGMLSEAISVRVFPDRGSWRTTHFTAVELADPGLEASLWGDDADPDGDGLSNCLEHLLQGDPRAASPELLPALDMQDIDGQTYAVYRYAEPIATGEAEAVAENSLTLETWQAAAAPDLEEIARLSSPGQVDRVTLRQLPAAGAGAEAGKFYRFSVRKTE